MQALRQGRNKNGGVEIDMKNQSVKEEYERRLFKENMFSIIAVSLFVIIVIGVIFVMGVLGYAVLKLFIWPCITSVF